MIRYSRLPADINERIDAAAVALENDSRVIFAYLFGGLATSDPKPLSDVDIAVYLDPPSVGPDTQLEIFGKLSDALGTGEIDLVILNTSPVSLTGRLLSSRRVIVDKDPFLRHRFESLELRKFFDFRIFEKRHMKRRHGIG